MNDLNASCARITRQPRGNICVDEQEDRRRDEEPHVHRGVAQQRLAVAGELLVEQAEDHDRHPGERDGRHDLSAGARQVRGRLESP